MMAEAAILSAIAKNVTIKVPRSPGTGSRKALSSKGAMVNVTLCFSANQAPLAVKAAATFISPFADRLGMDVIREIRVICDNYETIHTEIPRRLDPHSFERQAGGVGGAFAAFFTAEGGGTDSTPFR